MLFDKQAAQGINAPLLTVIDLIDETAMRFRQLRHQRLFSYGSRPKLVNNDSDSSSSYHSDKAYSALHGMCWIHISSATPSC